MKIPKMTKWPAQGARHIRDAWQQWRAEGFRLRITARAVTIVTREDGAGGGGVYRIPRTRQFTVKQSASNLEFHGTERVTVPFADEAAANRAMRRVGRRLMSNRVLVWTGRGMAVAVCWLLVSSYITVKQRQHDAQAQAQAGAEQATTPEALPAPQGPMQAFPGIPAAQAAEPMAPMGPPPAAPSQSSSTPDDDMGLGGFGLQMHPAATMGSAQAGVSTSIDAIASPMAPGIPSGDGPGCDPHLAFEAPAR